MTCQLKVPRGRADVAVSEQALDGVNGDAGFEQMRRKSMAEAMNATGFGDPGAELRGVIRALQCSRMHGLPGLFGRKEPRARAREFPVPTQLFEQAWPQHGVAILAAFALFNADGHPCRINISDPKVQDFVESQARGVGREEHRAMFWIRRLADHPLDLFAAQNR